MINMNFGIHPKALCVAQLLAYRDGLECSWDDDSHFYRADIDVAPWYNGRERGLVFSMRSPRFGKGQINIVVYEHRNSDEICLLQFHTPGLINPPTLADVPDDVYVDKYDVSASFSYNQIVEAADWIYDQLTEYWVLEKSDEVLEKA